MHWQLVVGRAKKTSGLTWADLGRKAREHFGVRQLRPGQRELIETVLNGGDAFGIMPTGAGKSLCYQLPALFLPKATVVVSPLLSLMQDQTEKLEEAGVETAKLDSTLTAREERETTRTVKKGQAELIYVTPERLENPKHLAVLKKSGVSLVVIDEAHCLSQWGHDFRPAYLNLRRAIDELGRPPILILTATATPEVEADILAQLKIPNTPVYSAGIDRPNLEFRVARTVNEEAKFKRLLDTLEEQKGNGIVYVSTVKLAEELYGRLIKEGVKAGIYHGKLNSADRESHQHEFMENRYKVMVATKAFGLGIDKPDVRFVVHYTFPDSVESYYQEAGRAGRDGKKAVAILLYRLEDKRVHSYFLGGKYPTRADAGKIYQTILQLSQHDDKAIALEKVIEVSGIPSTKARVLLSYLEKEGIVKRGKGVKLSRVFTDAESFEEFLRHYDERYRADVERIERIMKYGQTAECRAQFFREYFKEEKGKACKKCDNCRTKLAKPVALPKAIPLPVPMPIRAIAS